MNFHDPLAQHIFFEINDTRLRNTYQNKNFSSCSSWLLS